LRIRLRRQPSVRNSMFLIELERVPVKLMHNGATDSVGLPLPAAEVGYIRLRPT